MAHNTGGASYRGCHDSVFDDSSPRHLLQDLAVGHGFFVALWLCQPWAILLYLTDSGWASDTEDVARGRQCATHLGWS